MEKIREVDSAIYEANRIATAKAKRVARKLPAPQSKAADTQALSTCPRCQRIFRARISLVGHLRTQCTKNLTISTSTSNSAIPPSDSPTRTPGINSITLIIIETTSQYSSPVTPTTATTTAFAFTTTTTSDGDSLLNCPQCDRAFTSRISLVGHMRIHRTETGEPLPGAPHTSEIATSAAFTVLAPLFIVWAYSVTCASMRTEFTTMPTTPIPHTHPMLLPLLLPLPPPIPRMTSPSLSRFLLTTLHLQFQSTHWPGRSPANPSHGGW
ncbi:unnamed protein product [Schistocephalus solidus]|uniref:C2H2-type domain-containing protein n=1 Tax=Schistocephalus solidus TaxID=70667 RepID=A0A183SDW7_SCHSO|nr:unnamed protein product [Schistocephalus solidus]